MTIDDGLFPGNAQPSSEALKILNSSRMSVRESSLITLFEMLSSPGACLLCIFFNDRFGSGGDGVLCRDCEALCCTLSSTRRT